MTDLCRPKFASLCLASWRENSRRFLGLFGPGAPRSGQHLPERSRFRRAVRRHVGTRARFVLYKSGYEKKGRDTTPPRFGLDKDTLPFS